MDDARRMQPVIGISGGHANVDDRHVGVMRTNLSQHIVGVPGLRDDLEPRLLQ
jgi:hypothetical protein